MKTIREIAFNNGINPEVGEKILSEYLAQQEPVATVHVIELLPDEFELRTIFNKHGISNVCNGDNLFFAPPIHAESRKVFICKNCEGVYADQPVTQCDCMPYKNEFDEGYIVLLNAMKESNHAE